MARCHAIGLGRSSGALSRVRSRESAGRSKSCRSWRRHPRAAGVGGPATAEGALALTTIRARRYECQACGACMVVVPSDVLPGRLYGGPAIALALTLWAIVGMTSAAVRARVSPFSIIGATAAVGWTTLRRWAVDAGRRPAVRDVASGASRLHRAEACRDGGLGAPRSRAVHVGFDGRRLRRRRASPPSLRRSQQRRNSARHDLDRRTR